MSKDVYYFSHDSNARRDPKILALINKFGLEGYGRYWIIVEMLSEQGGYQLEHKKWVYYGLSMEMQCDVETVEAFIKSLITDYELLNSDNEYFWSDSLLRRMKFKDDKKQQRSKAAKKAAESRWNKNNKSNSTNGSDADAMRNDAKACGRNAIDAKGKESKAKESKGNEKKEEKKEKEETTLSSSSPSYDDLLSDLINYFQDNIGPVTPTNMTDLEYDLDDFNGELELLKAAIDICARKNKRYYAFFAGILRNWNSEGIKTFAQLKNKQADEEEWKNKKQAQTGSNEVREALGLN